VDYASFSSSVKVYVTAPGADLVTANPINLDMSWASDYIEVPAGDYQIRITPFDSDTVTIDSGTLSLPSGAVHTIVAVDAGGGGPPYNLLVLEDRTPPATDTGVGSIRVNAHTTGAPLDPDGYRIILDNGSSGQAVPVNGEVLLTDLAPGDHRVQLEGAADNCWLRPTGHLGNIYDAMPPVVMVTTGHTVSVTFDLACFEPGAAAIDVQVERTGDPFSYFTTLIVIRSDGLTHTVQPGVFQGLPEGSYQVWLSGGTPFHIQCVVPPPNPRTVDLGSQSLVTTVFQLHCVNE
jgi:hypothetical protein